LVGFKEVGFNFEALVGGLVKDFLEWLKTEGFEFKEELQVVFASYFALLELRTAADKLIKEYEKLPIFEGLDPERAYQKWLSEKKEKKVVEFKPRKGGENDSRSPE